jgi:hypothetical protein
MDLKGMFEGNLPTGSKYFGVLAEFANPSALYRGCERVRDAGYTRWDAHSPFPVHGLEGAMGMKRSLLPFIILVMALGGAAAGFGLQTWVHTSAYPLTISGKPMFAWQAFVPITFELGVLGGALGAVFGMFALNKLPMHNHPLFDVQRFARFSDDAFFISIESWDPKFDPVETSRMLSTIGATRVELVESGS